MQKQKRTALLAKSRVALGGLLAALMLSAVFASSAGAAPAWRFNGAELKGTETILGGAQKSGLTAWGFTTTCDNFLYKVEISNSGGTGKGNVTELPLFNCYTDSFCTVEAIEAESFPWPAELMTSGGNNYMKVKGVDVWILYGGWFCPLWGVWAHVTGSAGGLLSNATESATFSPSSFTATGSKLEALGAGVEWNGFFPAEAFTTHREESLSVS
jgi:hypothetical protein